MTWASGDRGRLEYFPCRYGNSRIAFRGPRQSCEGRYVACLGGTETYGRFVPEPYCAQLETAIGIPCVNFGVVNAGLDAFLCDSTILALAAGAEACVLQVMGAQNMSNRFYTVHPRRNDRFLRASDALAALYPEIDFTEHAFTRGMLQALLEAGPDRFPLVVEELQAAWLARMRSLLSDLGGTPILLWAASFTPPERVSYEEGATLGSDPLFVTRAMLEALEARVGQVVTYVRSNMAAFTAMEGMVFSDHDEGAAEQLLGAPAHAEIAELLAERVAQDLAAGGSMEKGRRAGTGLSP
ncbi:hypothetical protein OCH239_05685 [Roseivivax halodurans JCM 10272]|uniref:DUF6473 domain-containing protein n=1 Tax=Roseivivax halodurans JCM 10272 TaxID=1449350 RepID=X7EFH7_9RHOB|nr:DUF6473 family protein [Roseivivax halodurans]ETX13951.1 hypothetical protein OCH239_05685 [Roseivivax halodurans JCM 10272]